MGFIKKVWKNRISQYPKQYQLTQTANGKKQLVELELRDGTVTEEGDRFDAATMNDLEDRIEAALSNAGVNSFNGRGGSVVPEDGDYNSSQITHTNEDESVSDVETEINGLKLNKLGLYEQDSPYWDITPVRNSNNAVTSDGVNRGIEDVRKHLKSSGSSGTPFYFDLHDNLYGWNEASTREVATFHPFADANEINAELSDYVNITGVKNFIPPDLLGDVVSGVTYTYISGNGALILSGTSGDAGSAWNFSHTELPASTYILTTGQPIEEGTDVCIYALTEDSQLLGASSEDHGHGIGVFVLEEATTVYFGVSVEPEKEVDLTIFPMCRPASIHDSTFVPFAATNGELTKRILPWEKINIITDNIRAQQGIVGLQCDVKQCGYMVACRITYTPDTAGDITLAHGFPTNVLEHTFGIGYNYNTGQLSPNYIWINAYGHLKIHVEPNEFDRCRFSIVYMADGYYTSNN